MLQKKDLVIWWEDTVAAPGGHDGAFPPPQLDTLPPTCPQSEGWQKSAIFGIFLDFCPLTYAFFPLNFPPPPTKYFLVPSLKDRHCFGKLIVHHIVSHQKPNPCNRPFQKGSKSELVKRGRGKMITMFSTSWFVFVSCKNYRLVTAHILSAPEIQQIMYLHWSLMFVEWNCTKLMHMHYFRVFWISSIQIGCSMCVVYTEYMDNLLIILISRPVIIMAILKRIVCNISHTQTRSL